MDFDVKLYFCYGECEGMCVKVQCFGFVDGWFLYYWLWDGRVKELLFVQDFVW